MNITFLLGNGFDRSLGLETGYSDFYRWYVEQPTKDLSDHVKQFRQEIDKYIKKDVDANPYWSDAEIGLGMYTENFTLETVENFLDCYEDFKDNLAFYLKEQDALVSSEVLGFSRKLISSQLGGFLGCVDAAEQEEAMQPQRFTTESVHVVNFVSFNYTRTVDKMVDALKSEESGVIDKWRNRNGNLSTLKTGNVIHAHGYTDQWPILGVCEEYSIENKELLKNEDFKAVILKAESIRGTGELWRTDVKKLINHSTYICIFGMSLGETDSDYWHMVTKWLAQGNNRHLIVFWHNSRLKKLETSVLEKFRERNSIINMLFNYSELTSDEFERIVKRIHIVINKKEMFSVPNAVASNKERVSDLLVCINNERYINEKTVNHDRDEIEKQLAQI